MTSLLGSPAVLPDLLREGLLHLLIGNLAQGGRGEKDNCNSGVFSSAMGRGLHQEILSYLIFSESKKAHLRC